MSDSNRIPLRRFFHAGDLANNAEAQKIRKLVESAEKHETSLTWPKAIKKYKEALEVVNQLLENASEKSDSTAPLRQIGKELADKITDCEDLQAGRARSNSVSGRRRADSLGTTMDGDRSRSGTSSAPDLVSPLPPSNKDNASQLPSARSSVPKKPRDGRVRFVEQKKLYFYTDETPPSETLDILNGFVTALGLPEDEFDPLYLDCIHCIEFPLHSSGPDSTTNLTKFIRTGFGLSDAEHGHILEALGNFGAKELFAELVGLNRKLSRHYFYAQNTFKDRDDFNRWKTEEEDKLRRLIKKLKKKEGLKDSDIPKELRGPVEEDALDAVEESFEDDDPERAPERSPLRYDLLFRVLVARDFNAVKSSEIRGAKLQPLFVKLTELLESVPIQDPLDIDGIIFAEADNPKLEESLFITSKTSRWLLDEFSERYGFRPLYRLLVTLSWIVSIISTDVDKLLMLHVMLQRVMNLFKDDDYIYNKKELFFFLRIMKELNREVEQYIFNIFRYFDHTRLLALRLLGKVVILMFECNEFVNLSDEVRYDEFMIKAAEESIKNKYRDVISDTEQPKDPHVGDPIGTNTSQAVRKRLKSERTLSADQLIEAFDIVAFQLENVEKFAQIFPGVSLTEVCIEIYVKQLYSDVKLFRMKFADSQNTTRVLTLALKVREMNKKFLKGKKHAEQLPVEILFGPFLERWIDETEQQMKAWVTSACKQETWQPIDPKTKKLWSLSAEQLYRTCSEAIPFVKQAECMMVGSEETSLLKQYFKVVGHAMREYVEHIYNLFVDEFPGELHSDLHDLYIREYFANITTTGGAGGLMVSYAPRKKGIAGLFKRKSTGTALSPELASVGRFSTMRGSPKLGKSNPVADNIKGRTLTMNGRIQGNNDLNAQSLQASLNSREAKEYGIKVWNRIEFNPDKIKKLKKSRKAIDLTARMCIKLNDIETIRVQFEALCRSDKDYGTSFKTALTVMKKVYHIFVNMVIYVMNLYMEAEIEFMFSKSKKKPTKEAVGSVYSLTSYLGHQLLVMHANLKLNIFRRILLRIWKVIQEDVMDCLTSSDGTPPSLAQICALEDLMEGIKPYFVKYGMSASHLTQKVGEIYQISKKLANSDELATVRVAYLEMKDKYEKKQANKTVGKSKSGGTSLLDDSEELDAMDQMDEPMDGADDVDMGSESVDSKDSDAEAESDSQVEPPFPPSTNKRAGSTFERQDSQKSAEDASTEKIISPAQQANAKETSQGSSGSFQTGRSGRGKASNPMHPRMRNIMGGLSNVDTDDIGGGRSETEEVGRKLKYYDQTDREDSATEREDTVAARRGSQRKPPVLKIVAGGFDARAARRRGGDPNGAVRSASQSAGLDGSGSKSAMKKPGSSNSLNKGKHQTMSSSEDSDDDHKPPKRPSHHDDQSVASELSPRPLDIDRADEDDDNFIGSEVDDSSYGGRSSREKIPEPVVHVAVSKRSSKRKMQAQLEKNDTAGQTNDAVTTPDIGKRTTKKSANSTPEDNKDKSSKKKKKKHSKVPSTSSGLSESSIKNKANNHNNNSEKPKHKNKDKYKSKAKPKMDVSELANGDVKPQRPRRTATGVDLVPSPSKNDEDNPADDDIGDVPDALKATMHAKAKKKSFKRTVSSEKASATEVTSNNHGDDSSSD